MYILLTIFFRVGHGAQFVLQLSRRKNLKEIGTISLFIDLPVGCRHSRLLTRSYYRRICQFDNLLAVVRPFPMISPFVRRHSRLFMVIK